MSDLLEITIPKDVIEHGIIKWASWEFLGVAKWTRKVALVDLWRMGHRLGREITLGDGWFEAIIRVMRANGLVADTARFTALLGGDSVDRYAFLSFYVNNIPDKLFWRAWNIWWNFSVCYDDELKTAMVCWAYT
jgi:hypothetical protein